MKRHNSETVLYNHIVKRWSL